MCWEGKEMAEGVGRGGGNQIQLKGGLYLDSGKEPEHLIFFSVSVLELTAFKCAQKFESF